MPAETFDAYLDLAWNPQLNDRFGGELSIRTGIYSDFRAFDEDSIRLTGRALAVMTFSPATKIKFGIWYLNLVHNKLLPVGGVVWSPNPDVRFDILFPNPKFTERLPTVGATEWWWYFSGNYGGDAWTIKRGTEPGGLAGALDQVGLRGYSHCPGPGLQATGGRRPVGADRVRWVVRPAPRLRHREPEFVFALLHDLLAREPGLLTCTAVLLPGSAVLVWPLWSPGRRQRPAAR